MGLARDLVELEARIRDRSEIDVFAPIEGSDLLSTPEYASILPRVATLIPANPAIAMRLCLQALRIQHEEERPNAVKAELVATLPPDVPGIARPTERVVSEMICRAAKEVIVLGYELTDPDLVLLLSDAAARGADIIVICDRGRGSARRLLDTWPNGTRKPRVFCDRLRTASALYASMHAKSLLVDGNDLLVTSANFTFHGLHGNIEIGARLSGSPAAEARKIFSHLVEHRVVEELW